MKIKELYSLYLQSEGIITDSRETRENAVFFALKGKNFDGNKYAEKAIENGASYAVIDDPQVADGNRYILVDDVLTTLQLLANYHRRMSGISIIAITGSNGKTTTKELIKNILGRKYTVGATHGNLNNHIGVPVTILNFPPGLKIGIVEMGANHPGEIRNLCKIAEPDFGIITNIGKAHLEGFGTLEGVAKAKSELYEYLAQNKGTLFVNGENEKLLKVLPGNAEKVIYYGNNEGSICYGKFISGSPYIKFSMIINIPDRNNPVNLEIQTNLVGRYNIENAIAAACIGLHFNVPDDQIKNSLENYTPSNNRSELLQTGDNKIIMDAYNANPTSMKAAIENFSELQAEKKLLILGEMLELGEYSDEEHKYIIDFTTKMKLNNIILVGTTFKKITDSEKILSFGNVKELIDWLKAERLHGYHILIKGSRGNRLEQIVPYL